MELSGVLFLFFFFQAEDGIRDIGVTGVQTCALPIWVPLPGPEQSRPETAAFFSTDVAYHRALDWRFVHGPFNAPGPAAAWTRALCTLVEGEPMTPLQHLLVMTDAASGISAVLDRQRATFANVDLTLATV